MVQSLILSGQVVIKVWSPTPRSVRHRFDTRVPPTRTINCLLTASDKSKGGLYEFAFKLMWVIWEKRTFPQKNAEVEAAFLEFI
ncbi:hypothetical protein CEXT_249591 [Caerostris extrusa]|uniref:Uncharacterized protein n=1 Tax=Caerostris extrusa TaxID=172846 RepID=A0AAV4UHZ8_CAEEX|nr:hypothetical protein CEXT_249591 [Caerostris extrusa]